jgi:hypothetical protein
MRRVVIFYNFRRLRQNAGVPCLALPVSEPSRLAFLSVDGGFEDVRKVLSVRCPSTRSINLGDVDKEGDTQIV